MLRRVEAPSSFPLKSEEVATVRPGWAMRKQPMYSKQSFRCRRSFCNSSCCLSCTCQPGFSSTIHPPTRPLINHTAQHHSTPKQTTAKQSTHLQTRFEQLLSSLDSIGILVGVLPVSHQKVQRLWRCCCYVVVVASVFIFMLLWLLGCCCSYNCFE